MELSTIVQGVVEKEKTKKRVAEERSADKTITEEFLPGIFLV
jgi:hypothetical protein